MIVSVHVPFKTQHNGRKKLMVLSGECEDKQPKRKPNETLVKALARAWYWQKLLDEGKYSDSHALARKYRVHTSDMARTLRLNLLAPDVKKAILDGTQGRVMNWEMLKGGWSEGWGEQVRQFQ